MSWDVVLFNKAEKIDDLESLNVEQLVPINFGQAFEKYFEQIKKENDSWEITGKDFSIVHYPNNEPVTHCMVNLYGEDAIYAIAHLAQTNGWQVYDTGLGELLDLENPSTNGYRNFQEYLRHVLKK